MRHLVALDALEFRKSKKIVEGKIFDQCGTHLVSSPFVLLKLNHTLFVKEGNQLSGTIPTELGLLSTMSKFHFMMNGERTPEAAICRDERILALQLILTFYQLSMVHHRVSFSQSSFG